MARSIKQTTKAPLTTHQGSTGVRTIRAVKSPSPESRASAAATMGKPSSWPIYEELVAERGDPTA